MSEMATIDLPYVQRFRDRHGRWRTYYRRPGFKRVRLPDPGGAGFLAAYEAAAAQGKPIDGAGAKRTVSGTIDALIVAYYLTADYKNLRASTKRAHRNMLERFRAAHGDKNVRLVQPKHLEAIFQSMGDTPAQASNLRKRLRSLFDLAARLGMRDDNPVTATRAPRYESAGHAPWSEDDIAAFETRWPSGSRERLALALLLYTGQRRSDVVTMGRQHIRDGRMQVVQVKTGTRLEVPIHAGLLAEIEAAPKGLTLLLTEYGKPFSPAGFTSWFVGRARKAGVIGRTPHGLRKAAGRRLAEGGCTAHQIMSVLGHKTLSEAERYTRDVDQRRLADAAIALMQDGSRTKIVNPAPDDCQTWSKSLIV